MTKEVARMERTLDRTLDRGYITWPFLPSLPESPLILISIRSQDFSKEMPPDFEMKSHSYKQAFCSVNSLAFSIIAKRYVCFISKSLSPALSRLCLRGSMLYQPLMAPGDIEAHTQHLQNSTKSVWTFAIGARAQRPALNAL